MRKNDLTEKLRKAYTKERGFGAIRIDHKGYKNIWFVVPPNPPTEIPASLPPGIISKATTILQSRPHIKDASALDFLSSYLLAKREAISSSRMEGTWSTIDNVLTPGSVYNQEEGKSENLSVRGYTVALEDGLKQIEKKGVDALTLKLVCRIHKLIMEKDPNFNGVAGRIRTKGLPGDIVYIGGDGRKENSIFNPAPPEFVEPCTQAVMSWLRDKQIIEFGDAGMGMSLPVRIAIAHAHFEAVHPFSDGNGRIGRVLCSLQMAASGILPLYLSGYIEKNKTEYSSALQFAQKKLDYKYIIKFICGAIISSEEEEKISKTLINNMPNIWQQRANFRKSSSSQRALSVIVKMPIITAHILANELEVSFQAASNALNMLKHNHIVKERTGFGRNRVFATEEIIAILARPFGEDPEISLEKAHLLLKEP